MNKMAKQKRQSAYLHKQEEWKELYESGMSYTQIGKLNGVHYTTVQTVLRDVVKPRPKQRFAHLAPEWVKLYVEKEMSINLIAEQYKTDPVTVSKYLKKAGVELRRQYGQASPYEALIPEWTKAYESGQSLKEIAERYDTYPQTVHKHIQDKVEMREYAETSQVYELKHPDYLKEINTHQKAYWLGIWYGTGFLSRAIGGYEATLSVSAKDRSILERFKETIGFEKPLEEIQEDNTDVTRLRVLNKVFFESLSFHGLQENKWAISTPPTTLSKELYSSFILGYYEGKGSCYISSGITKGKEYKQITFSLFGNKEFLKELRQIIQEETGIHLHDGVLRQKNREEDVHLLRISSKDSVKKVADWLYSGNIDYAKHRDVREILKRI